MGVARYLVGAAMVALAVAAAGPVAQADSAQKYASKDQSLFDSAAGQFSAGIHRIGDGAQHIGEGIKQGATGAWEAVKAGAAAANDKLKGKPSPPKAKPPAPAVDDASR